MPLTEKIRNPELLQPRPAGGDAFDPRRSAFFITLFGALDQHGIRYCALRVGGGLLYGSDFAVHSGDAKKLGSVFLALKQSGYLAVQWLEIGSGGHRIVFASQRSDSKPEMITIDLVFGRHGGIRDKHIVQQRRREGIFWVASTELLKPSLQHNDSIPLQARIIREARKVRGHFSRKGACLVFLGPDGVGKTTLLRQLSTSLAPAFPEQSIYRWRPTIFARTPRPSSLPHSKPIRTMWGSIAYLLFACLDFTSGYVLAIRPVLVRGGLVIFDRYYHDLLVDPERYRYNGPLGLARLFGQLLPPRDALFVVLDAEEQTILSRKQQLPLDEIRRQRAAYREFAGQVSTSVLITTDQALDRCREHALQEIFRYLSKRLARRNPTWFEYGKAEWCKPVPAASLEERQQAQAD
jgi:thymidylate kinase